MFALRLHSDLLGFWLLSSSCSLVHTTRTSDAVVVSIVVFLVAVNSVPFLVHFPLRFPRQFGFTSLPSIVRVVLRQSFVNLVQLANILSRCIRSALAAINCQSLSAPLRERLRPNVATHLKLHLVRL